MAPAEDVRRRCHEAEHTLVSLGRRGGGAASGGRPLAGDVLLWLLLFGAAYLYFFGVPKWVNITLLGLACVKLLLDWMFTVWYRRQY